MKRHNFSGCPGLARLAPDPPHSRLDRRLLHAGPCVQGPEDGRAHGPRAGHHAEPRRRPGRRRTGLLLVRGAVPGPEGRQVVITSATQKAQEGQRSEHPHREDARWCRRRHDRARRPLVRHRAEHPGHAPGCRRAAGRSPCRHAEHQDPRRDRPHRQEEPSPEGRRHLPSGFAAGAAAGSAVAWPSARSRAATRSAPPRR